MTLDVTIGKLENKYENLDEELIEDYGEPACLNVERTLRIKKCPQADENICNPDKTIYPKTSKRSGSSGLWRFWRVLDNELYEMFREHPGTNDKDYAYLKPVIERIKNLDESDFDREKVREQVIEDKEKDERLESNLYGIDDVDDAIENRIEGHKSRLKWLKYWSSKAVDLYDEKAAIRFW